MYSISFHFLSLVFILINHISTPVVKMYLLDFKYHQLISTKMDNFNYFYRKFHVKKYL